MTPSMPRDKRGWRVDQEVRHLIDHAHADVSKLLSDHREQLESLSQAMLQAETVDAGAAYNAAHVPAHTPPAALEMTKGVPS